MSLEGRVKWFNNAKGYGFIECLDDSEQDIFVHYSAINIDGYKTLKQGEIVVFDLTQGSKGPSAANVRRPE